jgi:hypothetical protein
MKMTKMLKAALGYFKRLINDAIAEYRWQKAQREAAQRVAAVKTQYPDCESAMNVWPPTAGTTTGYDVDGITTIRWGTDGLLQSPKPTSGYYVVSRFAQKELIDNIKLPNGTGITSSRVRIRDGVNWSITVRDDTAMTAPVVGDSITIVDAGGMIGAVGLRYSATVVDNDYDSAIKQAGERVLVAENLILVESQTSSSQV